MAKERRDEKQENGVKTHCWCLRLLLLTNSNRTWGSGEHRGQGTVEVDQPQHVLPAMAPRASEGVDGGVCLAVDGGSILVIEGREHLGSTSIATTEGSCWAVVTREGEVDLLNDIQYY